MEDPKKKVSRPMMVTMDEDEFEKFDSGETHSKGGVRRGNGTLSALPDISPLSEEDMPTREIVKTENTRTRCNYISFCVALLFYHNA